jgi:hypothetical protein
MGFRGRVRRVPLRPVNNDPRELVYAECACASRGRPYANRARTSTVWDCWRIRSKSNGKSDVIACLQRLNDIQAATTSNQVNGKSAEVQWGAVSWSLQMCHWSSRPSVDGSEASTTTYCRSKRTGADDAIMWCTGQSRSRESVSAPFGPATVSRPCLVRQIGANLLMSRCRLDSLPAPKPLNARTHLLPLVPCSVSRNDLPPACALRARPSPASGAKSSHHH